MKVWGTQRLSFAITLLVLVLGSLGIARFYSRKIDGFALHKIQSILSFHPEWDVGRPPQTEQGTILSLFDQPYYYLAKGAQSYVFASADGKTVLKFFRLYHLRPPFWVNCLHFPFPIQLWKIQKMIKKRRELEKDFQSYVLAHQFLKEETGLLFLHLNKSNDLAKSVTLYDKLKIPHRVDLDEMEFLVQKKATLFYPAFAECVAKEGEESGKEIISSLIALLITRSQKGVFDKDPDLNTNFGLLEKTPLEIDVGRFCISDTQKSPQEMQDEIFRITDHFRQWLEKDYPALSNYLRQEIEKIAPFRSHLVCVPCDLFQSQWKTRPMTVEEEAKIQSALKQPYRYGGGGGQCYVFYSADNLYVLKLFKRKNHPHFIKKLLKTFDSFQLAFDQIPNETGMLYLHLNPTSHLQTALCVTNNTLFDSPLYLDTYAFALQKKADLAIERAQGRSPEEKARLLDTLLSFHCSLYQKGIRNKDPNFRSNYGFIGDTPILLDIGRLEACGEVLTEKFQSKERKKLAKRLQRWHDHVG